MESPELLASELLSVDGKNAKDSSRPQRRKAAYILLENPKKSTNWGPLLRCCVAYGIKQIVVVGYDKCSVQGSHGASKHIELIAFPTHEQAMQFIRDSLGCNCLIGLLGGRGNAYNDNGYSVTEVNDFNKPNLAMDGLEKSILIWHLMTSTNSIPLSLPLPCCPVKHAKCVVMDRKTPIPSASFLDCPSLLVKKKKMITKSCKE